MTILPKMTRLNPTIALATLSLLGLTACAKTLDHDKIAQSIQQDVIKQGGISLKSVTCPPKIEPKANESFECTGEMDTGYTFTIAVKQKDDQGTVSWDVPNTKGMLNLAKFETSIQEAVQGEVGARPIIRCGGDGYKPVKPGQIFTCKVDVKPAAGAAAAKDAKAQPGSPTKSKQPDKIVVAIDADGNVNWQRVVPGGVSQLLPKSAQPKTASAQATAGANPAAATDRPTAPPPPPAQKNAEDFLNQPGASNQFDD
jgi:hypothetical protein